MVVFSLSPELLAHGAFASRWMLQEVKRRIGVEPKREVRSTGSLTVALVPVTPPSTEGDKSHSTPTVSLQFDAQAFQTEVTRRLDAGSDVGAAALEKALTDEPVGLRSDAFLLVLCRGDGTAWFGLPPTRTHSPITNAALFCAALDRLLPSP